MQIKLICIGKTNLDYVQAGIALYLKRLTHYIKFDIIELATIKHSKNLPKGQLLKAEADLFLKHIEHDYIITLDEKGKALNSTEFSDFINQKLNQSITSITFLIGGAYGFHQSIYDKANASIALSKMTFPHQLVRLIFVEQLYRAFTIIKNESYHH